MTPRFFLLALAFLGWTLAAPGAACAQEKARRPNILIIVADDLGFTDLGCYGSEIATPNLDGLAKSGLRFTQFHNTARCWPSRSALLSGYYPQQIRMDPPKKAPPAWLQLLPHYLRQIGYRCYHSGKWHVHVLPRVVADGGFHRSYNLTDQMRFFSPKTHQEDDKELPSVRPDGKYYATTAIADHAVRCLKEHQAKYASQPFFEYLCFTAPHFPLHALPEDIARYRDRYLEGWDKLREDRYARARKLGIVNCPLPRWEDPTPSIVPEKTNLKQLGPNELGKSPPWSTLTADQKRFQATKMAIHAAMVDRMDQEIGRVLDQLRAMKALDDTLIFFVSDNGASAEILIRGDGHEPEAEAGSWTTHLCLGGGWASACNAPLRRFKVWVYEGGTSTPMIVHWPRGLPRKGELCHDVGHVIDFVPTLFELTGVKADDMHNGAKAPPMPGRSLLPAFTRDGGVTRDELYFHHLGNRALRMGNWKLVAEKQGAWELYDLATDRCEAQNLAAQQPDRVRQMAARWQELEDQWRKDAGE